MRVEKWWNEICGRGQREKPQEKPTQTPFRPPRNPHGEIETPASSRLRHGAGMEKGIVVNLKHFTDKWLTVQRAIFSQLSSVYD